VLAEPGDRGADVVGDGVADPVLQVVGDEVVEEVVGVPGPVGAHEDASGSGVFG
jgi:hypothetical protein